jgi:threonine dehydratase
MPITIFTDATASPLKIERMRALGAQVRLVGEDSDTHEAARAFAVEAGALLVEDGRDAPIAEGAGTIGIELLRWPEPFDAVLVPLGDGALLSGVARWIKAHRSATRMIGVCPSGAPAMERSWRAGHAQALGRSRTIADGIAGWSPFPEAVADLIGIVDDIVLVEDATLVEAMRLVHRELGVVL